MTTGPCRREGRGRPPGAVLVVAVAALAAVAVLAPWAAPGPAVAQDGSGDEATADGPGDVAGPTLRLEDQTTWVEPGGTYVLRVRVEGDVPAGAQVEATVHEATASRSDFREQVGGLSLGEVVGDPGRAAAPTGARGVAALRFATGEPVPGAASAPLDGAGVHPVEVRLVAEGAVLDRVVTHLVRLPDEASEAPPLRVAAVVPVDRGIAIAPNGRRRATPVGDERLDTLLEALLERPEVALTVVPTPETLVSLDGTPALTRLRRAADGRQVVSSQYVSLDLAAWVAAGLDDDLARQTTAGETALAELLVDRPDRRTAVASATLTPEALTRLEELGADQVVVPADALAPVDPSAFPTTLAQPFSVLDSTGQTARAVAADAGLAAHPGETGDPVLDAANLLADLAVVWFDRPSETRGVTFTLPRVWEPSPRFLDTLLSGLAESRLLAPVTLDQLFARVPPATVGGAADPDGPPLVRTLAPRPAPSLGQYPQALPLTRLTTEGFTSFAGADNPVVESMRRRLLVSGSQDFDRTQRRAYLEAISRQIDRAAAAVVAPESGNVTLTSRDGRIPLNISNENLYDVTVKIRFDSDKLTFPDGDTVIVHLPRSTVTPLDVDVRSRSSGSFPLRVVISSPDDIVLVSRSQFTVRSTAVSGVGIVLSVGAGLFLALWWASHFRRVRRARRLVAADEAAAAVAAGDEAAPPG